MQIPLTLPGPPEGVRAVLSFISWIESGFNRLRAPALPLVGFLGSVWGVYALVLLLPVAMTVMFFAFRRRPLLQDVSVFFSSSAEIILLTGLLTGEWRGAVEAKFVLPALGIMLVLMTWTAFKLVRSARPSIQS